MKKTKLNLFLSLLIIGFLGAIMFSVLENLFGVAKVFLTCVTIVLVAGVSLFVMQIKTKLQNFSK